MTLSIEIDDHTLAQLSAQAQAQGVTLDAYVRALIAPASAAKSNGALSSVDFEHALDELLMDSGDLPVLPGGFSRANIYGDHD